jgi:hypothetical protein
VEHVIVGDTRREEEVEDLIVLNSPKIRPFRERIESIITSLAATETEEEANWSPHLSSVHQMLSYCMSRCRCPIPGPFKDTYLLSNGTPFHYLPIPGHK